MKHLFLGLALALGLVLVAPTTYVAADSDSGSGTDTESWGGGSDTGARSGVPELDATVAGSALVLLLGASAPGAAEFCKWVDDEGVVHFAENCPENVDGSTVRTPPPPSEAEVEAAKFLFPRIETTCYSP